MSPEHGCQEGTCDTGVVLGAESDGGESLEESSLPQTSMDHPHQGETLALVISDQVYPGTMIIGIRVSVRGREYSIFRKINRGSDYHTLFLMFILCLLTKSVVIG